MRTTARSAAVAVAVLAATLAVPARASAHAALVESDPVAGSTLSIAPGAVALSFTEPLNERLSRLVVIAPDGERFEGTAVEDRTMRVPLTTSQLGVYRVQWRTVSLLDGHPLQGSFSFGVGVAPPGRDAGAVASEPRAVDVAVALLRTVELAGLVLAFGSLLVRRLGRREPTLPWTRPPVRGAVGVTAVGGSLVVLAEALAASPDPSPGSVWAYVATGLPGAARVARVAAEWFAFALAGKTVWVSGALVVAAAALAAAGHAAAAEPRWFAVVVDLIHVVAAAAWAGGVLALAFVRPPHGWRGPEGRHLLDRFTPVALVAFVVTVSAGALRGVQELSTFSDLFRTSYGITLTAKIVAVVVMAQLSVLAWRRVVGSLHAEAAVALLIVALAALLAAFPLPPARLAETEAEDRAPATSLALPKDGDLTLGASAGQVLVGLTLRPGKPGRNDVLVYLRPLEGEEAAAGMPVSVVVGGRPTPMRDCGPACRTADVELAGGEDVQVRVDATVGGTARFVLPRLPAPPAGRALRRAQNAMHELGSYRMDESLSSGLADIVTRYAFEAPDRARIDVRGGSSTVFLGRTRYVRQGPGDPWRIERQAPRLTVPSFVWDTFRPFLEPHVVGSEPVRGIRTKVISFFGARGDLPVWFRLWVGPDWLVLRAEMRTQGHFMDQRYSGFDEPMSIEPPDVPSE